MAAESGLASTTEMERIGMETASSGELMETTVYEIF